jgi:hypothetical protein
MKNHHVLTQECRSNDNSSEVQAKGCAILADSLTTSNSYNACSSVYENGLRAISEAMALHGSNLNVVEHQAITVLACIISSDVDSCTIGSVRNRLGNALINVLARYVSVFFIDANNPHCMQCSHGALTGMRSI